MKGQRLKSFAKIIAGQSPDSVEVRPLNGGQPFIQGNAEFGPITPDPIWECETAPKVARPADVLLSVRAPVGAVNIATRIIGIGRGVAAVRAESPELEGWLYWALVASEDQLQSRSTGSTFQAVSASDIGDLRLQMPVDPQGVADYLDHETAEIDDFISSLDALIRFSKERTQASITSRLDQASHSGDWITTRLGHVISINEGQVDPGNEPFASMPLIAPNHIESRSGRLLDVESAREQGVTSGKYFARSGQVIYSKIRPALMKATIAPSDCLCSADMYPLEANKHWLSNDYLLEFLLSSKFEQYAVTMSDRVAMPKLNRETLTSVSINLPPRAQQDEVVRLNKQARDSARSLIAESEALVLLARERRSALISAAVTGQIDVAGRRRGSSEAERLESELARTQ